MLWQFRWTELRILFMTRTGNMFKVKNGYLRLLLVVNNLDTLLVSADALHFSYNLFAGTVL